MRVYKRGDKYHYDFTYHGIRVRKATDQTNKYLAEIEANDALAKARDNGGVEILLRICPTFEAFAPEFLKWVLESKAHGKHTRKLYGDGWGMLRNTPLAKMQMDKITNHDCEMIAFPGSNFNANKALKTLKRMCSKAKEMKRLFGDLPDIELLEETERSIKMSANDALLIDSHWNSGESSESSRDAFRIICCSGMRPNECFSMRWEYVSWERAVYQNPKGKTKSARRDVPLNFPPFDCVAILKDRHKRMGFPVEGWVFPSPDWPNKGKSSASGHLTTINLPYNAARDKAGLPKKMVLYCARHGVSTAVAEVATLKETMQLLGHSHVQTAMKYQHPQAQGIGERLWEQLRTKSDDKFLKKVGVKAE